LKVVLRQISPNAYRHTEYGEEISLGLNEDVRNRESEADECNDHEIPQNMIAGLPLRREEQHYR